ncbi:hypothetical protein T492DRAFT_977051 [Pavlovales sp. CCMP2436]|nr:hypothetical protein T492DRAFT_977051 [Pavlovales sp. CCMP2436]
MASFDSQMTETAKPPNEIAERVDALKRSAVAHLRAPETLEWLLLALGRATEGRQLEDVRYLVDSALDGADGLAVLRSELATRYFGLGLGSPHAVARRLAAEQLGRLATAQDLRLLVEAGALLALPPLVSDPSLAVAQAASACLAAAAAACEGAELDPAQVLTPKLLADLAELAGRLGHKEAPVRLRALELAAKLALAGPAAFAAVAKARLLQMLTRTWFQPDLLERLSVLELLLEVGASADGLSLLLASHGNHPDFLASSLLHAPLLSFVARLANSGVEQNAALLSRGALPLCTRALANAPSDEVATAALAALQGLCASHGGSALPALLSETSALDQYATLEVAAQRALSHNTTLVRNLAIYASAADEEMRLPAIRFLHSLCLSARGALLVVTCEPLLEWLADYKAFHAADDVPLKRDVVTALLRQPAAVAQLSPMLKAALGGGGAGGVPRPRPRDAAAVVASKADQA